MSQDPTGVLSFRFAAAADIDQLVRLRLAMQREVNQLAGPVEDELARANREYFLRALDAGTYESAIVASDGVLVAAAGLVLYEKPPSLSGPRGREGLITNVYTAPELRGQGLATRLIEMTVARARERGTDRLHLGATELGLSVYKRLGFASPRFTSLELALKMKAPRLKDSRAALRAGPQRSPSTS